MVKLRTILKWLFIGLVILFIYAPILLLTINSFNKSNLIQVWDGFSLDHYKYFFSFDNEPLPAVINTLVLAAVVAVLSTLLGTIGAIGIFYSKKKWPARFRASTASPSSMPKSSRQFRLPC